MEQTRSLSTTELCVLAGCSVRQADVWTTRGILQPDRPNPGSGGQRRYPVSEAVVACVMAALSADGRPIREDVAPMVRGQLANGARSRAYVEDPSGIVTLVLDLARAEVLVWERLGASAGA